MRCALDEEATMGMLAELLRGAMGQGGVGSAMRQGRAPAAHPGDGMAGTVMALLPVVLAMLSKGQGGTQGAGGGMGGLGAVLEQFQRAGFGEQAGSWVSTGPNLPISPDVMAQVFGRDGLASIASQAGLDEQQVSAGLSEVLPDVVDRLTPQGQVPDLEVLAASVGDLQRRFGL
jgi:uncharacterized protein YidB (DUF937 family)